MQCESTPLSLYAAKVDTEAQPDQAQHAESDREADDQSGVLGGEARNEVTLRDEA